MTLYQWELQLSETQKITLILEAASQSQSAPLQIQANPGDLYELDWDYWGWATGPYGHSLDLKPGEPCRPEDLHFALRLPQFAPLNPRYSGPEIGPWEPVPEGLIS